MLAWFRRAADSGTMPTPTPAPIMRHMASKLESWMRSFRGLPSASTTCAKKVRSVLQAAAERRVVVVVLDGFTGTAAVLVAQALQPLVLQRCVFAHRSGECGHVLMLDHLGAQPLLDLGLHLGEGSCAALTWPLQSACAVLREMASFESAGVSMKGG